MRDYAIAENEKLNSELASCKTELRETIKQFAKLKFQCETVQKEKNVRDREVSDLK